MAAALAELYRVRGFAAVRVTPRLVDAADGRGRVPVAVRLEVVEGPRTVVAGVAFDGGTVLSPAELGDGLALTAGQAPTTGRS